MSFVVIDHDNDNEREAESRSKAEEMAQTARDMGSDNVEIQAPNEATQAEVLEHTEDTHEPAPEPPQNRSVSDDPIEWVPEHFVDEIQGVPTINRKGYAVLAEQYNVSVTAEPVTLASETEFEYAEFKATAETESGQEYSGFGSAHVDRQDGDDEHLLNELAETRAMKRATAWATGVGMTAVEELKNDL